MDRVIASDGKQLFPLFTIAKQPVYRMQKNVGELHAIVAG
jgi:hypothetical protein